MDFLTMTQNPDAMIYKFDYIKFFNKNFCYVLKNSKAN